MGMGHNPGTLLNTEKSGKRMFITPVHNIYKYIYIYVYTSYIYIFIIE